MDFEIIEDQITKIMVNVVKMTKRMVNVAKTQTDFRTITVKSLFMLYEWTA